MKRVLKGNLGYIKYRKTAQALKSLFGVVVIIALVLLGIKMHGDRNNVITVLAAVTAIPTGKAMVGLFMFIKYRSLTEERANELADYAKNMLPVYELVLSTRDKAFHADVAFVNLNNIIIWSDSKGLDINKLEKDIEKFLSVEDVKVKVQILTDERLFIKRVRAVSDKDFEDLKDKDQVITIANKLLILNI